METLKEAEKTTHHVIGVLVDNKAKTHNFESNLVLNSLAKTMDFQLTRSPLLVQFDINLRFLSNQIQSRNSIPKIRPLTLCL